MFHFQGYSWEVTTAEGGQGLDELLSSRKSVLNGNDIHVLIFFDCFVETTEWDDKSYSLQSQISNLSGVVLSQSFQSLVTKYFLCVEFEYLKMV